MLLIYTRVSTVEQAADDRTSLEVQERVGRGFAMSKGFNQFDTAYYTDAGVSASIPLRNRPNGKRLLEDAKSGDVIFAAKLDRMFRSASDALNMVEIFKEKNIKLVLFDIGSDPVAESALGQFFFVVIAAVAALERSMIRERMVSGKKAKKANLGHIGGVAPYGYRIVGHGRAAQLEPVESEQKVLAAVRERADLSLADMTRHLTAQGLVSRAGTPFYKMQVSRMLRQVQGASAC